MQGVNEATFAALGTELSKYYEKEMDAGMRALMDKMRTRNWGLVTHAVVQKTDLVGRTWSSLTANSADDFSASFQSKLRVRLGEYCGNTADMQKLVLKGVAALAKKGLAQIPIPGAGILKTLVEKSVTAATAAVVGAEGGIEGYLHGKSIEEADLVIANRGNKDGAALFRDDREAMAAAEAALAQYKHIANLINSMPSNITSLDEAVQYPGVAAKVRMAASDLRQQLIKVTVFLEGMQARAERVAELVHSDTDVMATKMAAIAKEVVYNTYQVAKADGVAALRNGTYEHRPPPPTQTGGTGRRRRRESTGEPGRLCHGIGPLRCPENLGAAVGVVIKSRCSDSGPCPQQWRTRRATTAATTAAATSGAPTSRRCIWGAARAPSLSVITSIAEPHLRCRFVPCCKSNASVS